MIKRSIVVVIPFVLLSFGYLGVEEAFSRGGRGGGGFSGGHSGGGRSGAVRDGGAAHRSPSMSSYSGPRSSASPSRPRASGEVASRPQRPSSPGKQVTQRPGAVPPGAGARFDGRTGGPGSAKPSQAELQQFLNLPRQQGASGAADLGKVGIGAAAAVLGYAGAQHLLGPQGPASAERPALGAGARPGIEPQPGTLPAQRPGAVDRPGLADRLGPGDIPRRGELPRAGVLPADRPGLGQRPGIGDRPGAGARPDLAHRPSQLPARTNADEIRGKLGDRYDNLFTPQWWKDHPHIAHGYWDNFGKYQYARNHWWRHATWAAVGAWVVGASWASSGSPTYYDYGESIYYEGDQVYEGGKPIATAEAYYQQASQLASGAPSEPQAETEWLPLGVFAITHGQSADANMILQLAVNKQGVIQGTYYNTATDTVRPIRGMVDKKTQRAAWTFADGKNTDIIMETGLYNLTQDQTDVLVHFGKDKTQQWLMVRLNEPKPDKANDPKAH